MGQKASFGTQNALISYQDQAGQLEVLQEQDESLIWNPAVHGFVNRNLYEKALETGDPTSKSYRGVSPNFGGGNIKEWETIGKTAKRMKKLTTVLSKN